MKNVHLLQTEVYPAKLQLDRDYGTLTIFDEPCVSNGQDFVGANMYITSNEEIQIGEWCFEIYNRESTAVAPRFIDENNNTWWLRQINMSVSADDANCKKIILTTDVRLIKDGVQAIDDEFLDWFIKNQKREIPIITTTVNNESRYTTNIGFESWRKETPEQENQKPHLKNGQTNLKKALMEINKDNVLKAVAQHAELLAYISVVYARLCELQPGTYSVFNWGNIAEVICFEDNKVVIIDRDGIEFSTKSFPISYLSLSEDELKDIITAELEAEAERIQKYNAQQAEYAKIWERKRFEELEAEYKYQKAKFDRENQIK